MNRQELIEIVADQAGLAKSDARKAVEALFDQIADSLSRGDEVRLVGFGTFSATRRRASTGRNPRTGESLRISASMQPKFKAGRSLREAVDDGWGGPRIDK